MIRIAVCPHCRAGIAYEDENGTEITIADNFVHHHCCNDQTSIDAVAVLNSWGVDMIDVAKEEAHERINAVSANNPFVGFPVCGIYNRSHIRATTGVKETV